MSAAVFASLFMVGGAYAASAPVRSNMLQRWMGGTWYGTVRGEMSLLNWKNEYSSDVGDLDGKSDSFSFEPVFGGSLAIGHIAANNWRGEVEAGLIGQYSDAEAGANFELTIPYVSVNAIYDLENNVYVGGGLGFALPKADLSVAVYNPSIGDWISFETEERALSPKFDLMVGYSYLLAERVNLDFRYRLSVLFGPNMKADDIYSSEWLKTDVGTIFSNSFSVGVRYEF